MEQLALLGGPKAVTVSASDRVVRIGDEEIEAVVAMMRRYELSSPGTGESAELEKEFAAFIGTRFCLAQITGTSTLHSAYFAAGVGPGDEVIVPSYTWGNMVLAVMHANGIPVFADIDPQTLTLDPADVERKITPRTKAICVAHLWGNVADMDSIMEIAGKHGVKVIENCAHAHGAEYKGKKVGSIGDIGCFSFQASKAVAGGEGGAIVCSDVDIYERILILGHQGRITRDLITDRYRELGNYGYGYKYRAHPLAMGMARVQLRKLGELNRRRRENFAYLDAAFREIPGVMPTETSSGSVRGGMFGYRALYQPEDLNGLPRARLIEALQAEGVPVNPCWFTMMHLDPAGAKGINLHEQAKCPLDCPKAERRYTWQPGSLPATEDVHPRLLALPPYTEPEAGLLDQIIAAFKKVSEAARAGELSQE